MKKRLTDLSHLSLDDISSGVRIEYQGRVGPLSPIRRSSQGHGHLYTEGDLEQLNVNHSGHTRSFFSFDFIN